MKRLIGLALMLAFLPRAHADLEALRAAAQSGDVTAQLELGQLYEFGFGLKENAVPAMAWYLAASRAGNERAEQRAQTLKPKLSAGQLQEAERLSREWASAPRAAAAPAATPSAAPAPAEAPGATTPAAPSKPAPPVAPTAAAKTDAAPALPAASPPASPRVAPNAVTPADKPPVAPPTSTPGPRPSSPAVPAAPNTSAPAPAPSEDNKLGPG